MSNAREFIPEQPFYPILSSEIPDVGQYSAIREVVLTFGQDKRGFVQTSSSYHAFQALKNAANGRYEVHGFIHGGRSATDASLAALNCYLRSARAMGRMRLPWERTKSAGVNRWAWSDFCSHLGLAFR